MFQAFVTTQVSIGGRSVVPGASVCTVSGVAVSDIDAEGLAVCAHVSVTDACVTDAQPDASSVSHGFYFTFL